MNKADKYKLLYLFSISLLIFWNGCIDNSVQNIPEAIDLRSQIKVVNLTSSGAATVNIYANNTKGQKLATSTAINVGEEYPADGQNFLDLPAGVTTITAAYAGVGKSDTSKQSLESDIKMRLFLIEDATGRRVVKSIDRYIGQEKSSAFGKGLYPADTACVKFFCGLSDSADALTKIVVKHGAKSGADTTVKFVGGLKIGESSSYHKFKVQAKDSILIYSGTDKLSTLVFSPRAQTRYSAVVYGSKASSAVLSKIFTDD